MIHLEYKLINHRADQKIIQNIMKYSFSNMLYILLAVHCICLVCSIQWQLKESFSNVFLCVSFYWIWSEAPLWVRLGLFRAAKSAIKSSFPMNHFTLLLEQAVTALVLSTIKILPLTHNLLLSRTLSLSAGQHHLLVTSTDLCSENVMFLYGGLVRLRHKNNFKRSWFMLK